MSNYSRIEGESNLELIYRICSEKDTIGTWQDVANILNDILGEEYTESKYRKDYQAFQKIMSTNRSKFSTSDAQLEEIKEAQRALEREKVRFRDERNAWQRQNFIDARVEDTLDKLEESLSEMGRIYFETEFPVKVYGDFNNEMIVLLSDLHVGAVFNNYWGRYDSDIARDRLTQLLGYIYRYKQMYNIDICHVILGGDLISGNIHASVRVTNRENIIDQVKTAAELITSFCYELTRSFADVHLISVSGNHSRIDRKDDALKDERLDDLVTFIIEKSLSHLENFYVTKNDFDTSIAVMQIKEKTYVAVHGDYDNFSKTGVQNLCTMLGFLPEAVFFGHMHTNAVDEANGIKMIRGGSLAGSGDNFTVERRLSGKPSQMICICDDSGIIAYHPVYLK